MQYNAKKENKLTFIFVILGIVKQYVSFVIQQFWEPIYA